MFLRAGERFVLHLAVARNRVRPGPPPDRADFDVLVDGELVFSGPAGEGGVAEIDRIAGTVETRVGEGTTLEVGLPPNPSGAPRQVEIWFPYAETVWIRGLESDAGIDDPAPPPPTRWVHYGSSISQGANAATPTGAWPVVAARLADFDLVNLGMSGQAVLDPFVARAIRDQRADVISLKVGINVLNGNAYGRRMFGPLLHGFLDTIRDGHPTTPLLVASPLFAPIGEQRPGPTSLDPQAPVRLFRSTGRVEDLSAGALTLEAMREITAEVVRRRRDAGDAALHYVDGLDWYGPRDWARMPMADALHPDPLAHEMIGGRAAEALRGVLA